MLLRLVLAAFVSVALCEEQNFPDPVRAMIQTCNGCRLKGLPEVKKFLQSPGGAEGYKNLEIKYITGLDPELKFYDDEDLLMAKIPLANYSAKEIHELLQRYGFKYEAPNDESDDEVDDFKIDEDL